MTLTAEQSSNKARYEAATTAEIIDIIRTAMGEGCIRPCHVYDAVDELICRIQALEKRPKRNCDVGTAEEQDRRFKKFCNKHCRGSDVRFPCLTCPLPVDKCQLAWAQMPYEAEEGGAAQ
jgi:hypothetical protein